MTEKKETPAKRSSKNVKVEEVTLNVIPKNETPKEKEFLWFGRNPDGSTKQVKLSSMDSEYLKNAYLKTQTREINYHNEMIRLSFKYENQVKIRKLIEEEGERRKLELPLLKDREGKVIEFFRLAKLEKERN